MNLGMGKINFTKMHGLGNDYIYINVLENKDLKEIFSKYSIGAVVRYLSNRNFGVGRRWSDFYRTKLNRRF